MIYDFEFFLANTSSSLLSSSQSSGLGGWRLGWHHEQQWPVSCIPVAHFLSFTKKCHNRMTRPPSLYWVIKPSPSATTGLEPVKCPVGVSEGSARHKNWLAPTGAFSALSVHSVYLNQWLVRWVVVASLSTLYLGRQQTFSGEFLSKAL